MSILASHPLWRDTAPAAAAITSASTPSTAPLRGDVTCDVAVVGAGIVGLTTALELARAGRRVVVLEARHIGAGTTGGSTAKVSLVQGTRFSTLAEKHHQDVLRRYAAANLAGQDHVRAVCDATGAPYDVVDGVSYAATAQGRADLAREAEAMRGAGLDPVLDDGAADLPFPTQGSLRLPGQLQIDPQAYLHALLRLAVDAGVRVHDGTTVDGLTAGRETTATEDGSDSLELRVLGCTTAAGRARVRADHVVVTTGTPVLDRGGFFARLEPLRSYAVAMVTDGARPPGMYLSVDSPSRSIRRATGPDGTPLLVVGGNGHVVGRGGDTREAFLDLEAWGRSTLGAGMTTHRWAAQDYRSTDGLPFVGRLEPWSRDVWCATGFAKWGMTQGTAAALALVGHLTGEPVAWAGDWDPWRGDAAAQIPDTARLNGTVAATLAKDWLNAMRRPAPDPAALTEGEGDVGRSGNRPIGVARTEGEVHAVRAICPHLGGILRWNPGEGSWDCPLHGSRFAADGTRLEGPARCGLERVEPDGANP